MTAFLDPNAAMSDLAPLIRDAASGSLEAQRQGRAMALSDMHASAQVGNHIMGQGLSGFPCAAGRLIIRPPWL